MNKRFWFRIHSFTGVITGLLLFVICWSGTFATVAHEIDWLVTPESQIEVGVNRASWSELFQSVQVAYPDAVFWRVSAPLYPRSAVPFVVNLPHQDLVRIYVDPHTTKILNETSYLNVHRFFRNLHMQFFIPEVGLYLV